MLDAWLDHASAAGLGARELALGMARTNLLAGDDVIVPQLLARPEFIVELERLGNDVDAAFLELALMAPRQDVDSWFASRSAAPQSATHVDAQALAERQGTNEVDRMCSDFVELVASRPQTRVVQARVGEPEATPCELERVLGDVLRTTSKIDQRLSALERRVPGGSNEHESADR